MKRKTISQARFATTVARVLPLRKTVPLITPCIITSALRGGRTHSHCGNLNTTLYHTHTDAHRHTHTPTHILILPIFVRTFIRYNVFSSLLPKPNQPPNPNLNLNRSLTPTLTPLKQTCEVVRTSRNVLPSQRCPHFISRVNIAVIGM